MGRARRRDARAALPRAGDQRTIRGGLADQSADLLDGLRRLRLANDAEPRQPDTADGLDQFGVRGAVSRLRATMKLLHYASGHYALLHGYPRTGRVELWRPWAHSPDVLLPIDSPLFAHAAARTETRANR